MSAETGNPISRLTLERWALGRLDEEQARALERAMTRDQALRRRAECLRQEIERARQDLPPLVLPQEEEKSKGWLAELLGPWRVQLAFGVGLAALALLALLPPREIVIGEKPSAEVVFRGAMDLQLHRIRQGEIAPQGALVQAREGDRLQYQVTSDGQGVLQVLNLQADGQLLHYLQPRALTPQQPIQGAVILDDYAGMERIFFVISPRALDREQLQAAIQRAWNTPLAELDALPGLGAGVVQRSVLVVKEGE